MNDFKRWYEYMIEKGFLSPTINVKLMKMAFIAGHNAGFYDADTEGEQRPYWYAPPD